MVIGESGSVVRLRLDCPQILAEPTQAAVPEVAIVRQPIIGGLQRRRVESARTELRILASRYEPGVLENLEVLRDRRQADIVGGGEFVNGGISFGKTGQDVPPRACGEREEDAVKPIVRHRIQPSGCQRAG